jgi:hypothetical protein
MKTDRPTSVRETLERVRELLSDRERWTQGRYAQNADGAPADPEGPFATAFCLIGACRRVDGPFEYKVIDALFDALPRTFPGGIADYNDTHTHRSVLRLIGKAIAATPEPAKADTDAA